jgi:hypothetical protein
VETTSGNTTNADSLTNLKKAIIQCVSVVARRVKDESEKLEAVAYIIERISSTQRSTYTTSSLLQCVREVLV